VRFLFIISVFLTAWACQKENRLQVPISTVAAGWVPADRDSVRFSPEFTTDSAYIRYNTLLKQWVNVSSTTSSEVITQGVQSLAGSFLLNFRLETETPENLPTGGIARRENLTITNPLGQAYFISFYRDTITTDLFIVDSLTIDSQLYLGVLTDNQTFYYNRQYFVFRYLDNNVWHNLIR